MTIFPPYRWQIAAIFLLVSSLLSASRCEADTYENWKSRVFSAQEQGDPAVSGENACPAGDGVCNLLKYAFDLDPHQNGVAGLPTVSTVFDLNEQTGRQEPFLAITYRTPTSYLPEDTTDLTYVPEVSGDLRLSNWYRGPAVTGFLGQQAPQNFGDPTLYTYKARSPLSANPGGLFLRLRVVKGHQLPPEWLQQYFGGANADPDADPDGDSVSNWDEFLNGTDPTDYYNAQAPQLSIAGGGNQRGNAGTLLPLPVSVRVNYYGDQNAPLRFTATGGALLAPDANGTYQPNATIDVRSTGQINVDGSQTYVAQAYVYLPATVSAVSTITASATTAGQTSSVATVAIASDPNLAPPGGLEVAYNTDTYVHLVFAPSDATLPVSIEVSQDLGATWATWAVAPPGATAYDVTGLPHDVRLRLRAFTGVDGSGPGSPAGANPNAGAPPLPTSQPSGAVDALVLLQARLEASSFLDSHLNWSFAGCLDPSVRFQHLYIEQDTGPDYSVFFGYLYETIFPINVLQPGMRYVLTQQYSADYSAATHISFVADTNTTGHGYSFALPGNPPSLREKVELSQELKLPDFWDLADFYYLGSSVNDFSNRAVHDHLTLAQPINESDPRVPGADHEHLLSKVFYGFKVNKDPNGHLGFDEVFLPKGGGAPVHHVQVWDTKGAIATPSVEQYTLDPILLNHKALGVYRVLAVELRATDHRDDPGVPGALVPSVKTDGTGGKHFVVPRQAGGTVSVRAVVSGELEPGTKFDDLYEFAPLGSDAVISGDVCQVKTDRADKYVVQVRTKDAAHTVIASMNVWVVWATTQPVVYGPGSPQPIGVGKGGGVIGAEGFLHTVAPTSIFTDADRPALDGAPSVPAPGVAKWDKNPLSGGATKHWDASRKVSGTLTLPADVPPEAILPPVPPSRIDFVSDDLVGNDDAEITDESNDPYHSTAATSARPAVPQGGLLSVDAPLIVLAHAAGNDGEKASWVLDLKEFVRLEIGGQWYRISEDTEWHINLRLQRVNGKWIDDGTAQGPSAP